MYGRIVLCPCTSVLCPRKPSYEVFLVYASAVVSSRARLSWLKIMDTLFDQFPLPDPGLRSENSINNIAVRTGADTHRRARAGEPSNGTRRVACVPCSFPDFTASLSLIISYEDLFPATRTPRPVPSDRGRPPVDAFWGRAQTAQPPCEVCPRASPVMTAAYRVWQYTVSRRGASSRACFVRLANRFAPSRLPTSRGRVPQHGIQNAICAEAG